MTWLRSQEARALLWQFCRFAAVGATNTGLSFAVYWLLIAVLVPYPLAGAVGFAAGAVNGYLLNRRWTFASEDSSRARARYLLVQLGGLGSTTVLLWLLASGSALGPLASYAITIPAVTVATFVANRSWTFSVPG